MNRLVGRMALAGFAVALPLLGQVVSVAPTTAAVHLGTTYLFSPTVTGVTPNTVTWTVALPSGGTGQPGSISGGRYTPPAVMPVPNTVIVTATSVAAPTVSAKATITLQNPYPAVASTLPARVAVGPFSVSVNGSGFVSGSVVSIGGVAAPTTYVSATRLTATGTATAAQNGKRLAVAVANPAPGPAVSVDAVTLAVGAESGTVKMTPLAASRFLHQAAFGPDADTATHLQYVGIDTFLNEQFAAPVSPYPDPAMLGTSNGPVQARFFTNAVHGQDQLRQRVALALHEIFVISGVEESNPAQMVPYLRVLQQGAFGNFRQLMRDVTLNVAMGEYLDMRNNDKANPVTGTLANENYARELLQLFTIGLVQLNLDGTVKTDSKGVPLPTYDQKTVQEFAKVYTGWTYPTKPGAVLAKHNPSYYEGPMVAYEANHDTTAKTLLNGTVLPAGQTANADLNGALDNIFQHSTVAPFISKQLIQHLVTSNPSAAYVTRVATVFNNNGAGVRGDLKAVVKAILTDSEARAGDAGPTTTAPTRSANGHLREPVLLIASILRGLGAQVNDTNSLAGVGARLGQNVFSPPSVFSYFAPGYQVPPQLTPGATWSGPEFQNVSPDVAVGRYNAVNTMIYGNLGTGAVIDLTPFTNVAANGQAVVTMVSDAFFGGRMSGQMQSEILAAVNANTGTTAAVLKARAQAALYLALTSGLYNVAR